MGPSKLALLVCLVATACAGGAGDEKQSVASAASDAGGQGADDASPYAGDICCQVTDDLSSDPRWQNGRYGCHPDAAVSLQNVPWLCNPAHPTNCDDPACIVGSTCQGFNGTGVVLPCSAP
jgi:hypothetical protein